jgi:hypothetical protein
MRREVIRRCLRVVILLSILHGPSIITVPMMAGQDDR